MSASNHIRSKKANRLTTLNPHRVRNPILQLPSNRNHNRLSLRLINDPRARLHSRLATGGMISTRHRLPLHGLHNLLLDIIIMIIEARFRAQLAAVLEVLRTRCRQDRGAGSDGELDGAGAYGARAAPDEDGAMEVLGVVLW